MRKKSKPCTTLPRVSQSSRFIFLVCVLLFSLCFFQGVQIAFADDRPVRTPRHLVQSVFEDLTLSFESKLSEQPLSHDEKKTLSQRFHMSLLKLASELNPKIRSIDQYGDIRILADLYNQNVRLASEAKQRGDLENTKKYAAMASRVLTETYVLASKSSGDRFETFRNVIGFYASVWMALAATTYGIVTALPGHHWIIVGVLFVVEKLPGAGVLENLRRLKLGIYREGGAKLRQLKAPFLAPTALIDWSRRSFGEKLIVEFWKSVDKAEPHQHEVQEDVTFMATRNYLENETDRLSSLSGLDAKSLHHFYEEHFEESIWLSNNCQRLLSL